jgi:hypothetical protein
MTVRIAKQPVNIREKLSELERPIGINGQALLATDTPQQAFDLLGARNRNLIINGGMAISQRGTSFSPAATGIRYCLDRFYTQSISNNITITQSSDAPTGFKNSLLLTMGTATTLDYMRVGTTIEGFNFSSLAFGTSSAKTFTLSFWVKCSLTGSFGVGFRNGTSPDGTGTTTSRLASYTINSANTWEYKTITIPGATSQTWGSSNDLGLNIKWDIGDSAARSGTVDATWQTSNSTYPVGLTGGTKVANTTGATFYITGCQLEQGKVATPFEYRSYGEELALCQRYYERWTGTGSTVWYTGHGYATQIYLWLPYKVPKRTSPSGSGDVVSYSSATANALINAYGNTNTSGSISGIMTSSPFVVSSTNTDLSFYINLSASTYTPYGTAILWGITNNNWIDVSSEF